MPFFRKGQGKHTLAVAMTALKLGDRLLEIGCSDVALLAAVASKAGLSGRACAVVETEADAARLQSGAARAGTLLEVEVAPFGKLPFPDNSFDVVVIDSQEGLIAGMRPEDRIGCLREARRVLVPRGRAVVIERVARPGIAGVFFRQPVNQHYRLAGGSAAALRAEGFRAVRVLAERDGLSFIEGIR